jgi:hypothetical protein
MIKKIALTASVIMLIAISGATAAEKARSVSRATPASENALKRSNSFASAASTSATGPNAHRYRGGPKSIN